MTLFLVASEIKGGVFKVYAKKQQQKIRQPDYRRTSGGLIINHNDSRLQDSQPTLAWSVGRWPLGAKSVFIKWTGKFTMATPCWQHHKYSHGYYYIIIITITSLLLSYYYCYC